MDTSLTQRLSERFRKEILSNNWNKTVIGLLSEENFYFENNASKKPSSRQKRIDYVPNPTQACIQVQTRSTTRVMARAHDRKQQLQQHPRWLMQTLQ